MSEVPLYSASPPCSHAHSCFLLDLSGGTALSVGDTVRGFPPHMGPTPGALSPRGGPVQDRVLTTAASRSNVSPTLGT
jgi:hypothetical protein